MTVIHCNTTYIRRHIMTNISHHMMLHPYTVNIHMIQTSIGCIGRNKPWSQQASVATNATFIHNEHLYQTDRPQPECTQHLYSANIHTRQTGISRNKYQSQQDSTHIHRKHPYKTDNYWSQQDSTLIHTSIQNRQLLVATDTALTIYAQQECVFYSGSQQTWYVALVLLQILTDSKGITQRGFLIDLITLLNGMTSNFAPNFP